MYNGTSIVESIIFPLMLPSLNDLAVSLHYGMHMQTHDDGLEVCVAIQGNPATQVIKSSNHPIIRSAARSLQREGEEVSQLNQQIRPSQHIRQTLLRRVLVERDIQRVS